MGIIRDQVENERIAKAKLNGDNTQTFKVADAVNANEAVSKAQLDANVMGSTAILTSLKTVDGTGSGLDADLLDGKNGNTYVPKIGVSYVSSSQYNNFMMVINGKLYTASGNASTYATYGTGRYYASNAGTVYGVAGGLSEVIFPNLPITAKLVEVGGNGYVHNYALFDNGYLYTWGDNMDGSCGLGHNTITYYPILALIDCVKVWSGDNSKCHDVTQSIMAVERADGYTYVTGSGDDGNFGFGNVTNLNTFTQLTWLGTNVKFVGVHTGYGSMMIYQKADGTIWAAGNNEGGCGFIGNTTATYSTAVDITANVGGATAGDIVYLHHAYRYYTTAAIGSASSLLMRKDANGVTSIYTAGYNAWGQRGDGTTTASAIPYNVPNMADVKQIVCTGGNVRSVYVLKNNGDLYFWGYSANGQSGVGTANVLSPTLVTSSVSRILMGELESNMYEYPNQMFIEKTNGSIWCAGENTDYYLGLGHNSAVLLLTENTMLTSISQKEGIKYLGDFTTATWGRTYIMVTNNNKMYVWGYNIKNGISNHSTINTSVPTRYNLPQGDV